MIKFKASINSSIIVSIILGILLSNILIKIGSRALFIFSQLELVLHLKFLRILEFSPLIFALSFMFVDFKIKSHLMNLLRSFVVIIVFVVIVFFLEVTDSKLFAPIGSINFHIEDYQVIKTLQIFNRKPKIAVIVADKIYYSEDKEKEIKDAIDKQGVWFKNN